MKSGPIILACLAAYPMGAQTDTGVAFKVHVVSSVTGTPIAGANIVLDSTRGDKLWGRTDTGGIFMGRTHAAGSHILTVTIRGYRMIGSGGMGKLLEVKTATENETTVEMLPLSVIAGRVLDQYGDPVGHAIVRTEDKVSVPGHDEYYQSYSSATTDDRGEYRIREVAPGKHYVVVEYSSSHNERYSGSRSRYRWPEAAGLVLYPNATDIEQAQQVEVSSGRTARLNDIRINIQRPLTISGRIKPPAQEADYSVSLERALKLGLAAVGPVDKSGRQANGTFKMEASPGTYILRASDRKTGRVSEPLTVEVRDKDITNLEVELTAAYQVRGRFKVDGPDRLDFSKLLLNFLGASVEVDANGSFQTNLHSAKAGYILQGLPEDWYVKDVSVAGRRITGRQFDIQPGTTDLSFTLSPRGARLEIGFEAQPDHFLPLYIVLLPDGGPVPDIESIPHAMIDRSGKFIVRSVPPGSYRLFTLDATNWTLLMRPDLLMEKHRSSAPLIEVAEGDRKSMVVPMVRIQLP